MPAPVPPHAGKPLGALDNDRSAHGTFVRVECRDADQAFVSPHAVRARPTASAAVRKLFAVTNPPPQPGANGSRGRTCTWIVFAIGAFEANSSESLSRTRQLSREVNAVQEGAARTTPTSYVLTMRALR